MSMPVLVHPRGRAHVARRAERRRRWRRRCHVRRRPRRRPARLPRLAPRRRATTTPSTTSATADRPRRAPVARRRRPRPRRARASEWCSADGCPIAATGPPRDPLGGTGATGGTGPLSTMLCDCPRWTPPPHRRRPASRRTGRRPATLARRTPPAVRRTRLPHRRSRRARPAPRRRRVHGTRGPDRARRRRRYRSASAAQVALRLAPLRVEPGWHAPADHSTSTPRSWGRSA